jgi:aminopeptidase N
MTRCSGSRRRFLTAILGFVVALGLMLTVPAARGEDTPADRVLRQQLTIALDMAQGELRGTAEIMMPAPLAAGSTIAFDLNRNLQVHIVQMSKNGELGPAIPGLRGRPVDGEGQVLRYAFETSRDGIRRIVVVYSGTLQDDVAAGERAGEVHNFSVQAHISESGVFLSEAAAWYPVMAGDDGVRTAIYDVEVEPIEGWSFVASGDPVFEDDEAPDEVRLSDHWRTPRPTQGVALVGNRHRIHTDRSASGVEIAVHTSDGNARLAPLFADAAKTYLDLYEPRLGPYPYRRFSIVENFFSSGFAFPGFTLLDQRLLAMGPRALMPGMLDHELVHNWWGNGVYIPGRGENWCEALTAHNANMSRPGLEGDAEHARTYRRGNLMKLAADPSVDPADGPALDKYGQRGGASRYVGYDKGSLVVHMLAHAVGEEQFWAGLARFAEEHMAEVARWDDIAAALDPAGEYGVQSIIDQFVRRAGAPQLEIREAVQHGRDLRMELAAGDRAWTIGVPIRISFADGDTMDVTADLDGRTLVVGAQVTKDADYVEVDPDFHIYRLLPPSQIIPTINGTVGGPMRFIAGADGERAEVAQFVTRFPESKRGMAPDATENLFVIGRGGVEAAADVLARASVPLTLTGEGFTLAGTTYEDPAQAALHTVRHPDDPARTITVFISNGDVGWEKLRLVTFYRRDSTVVWQDGDVLTRFVEEPDRRVPVVHIADGDDLEATGDVG